MTIARSPGWPSEKAWSCQNLSVLPSTPHSSDRPPARPVAPTALALVSEAFPFTLGTGFCEQFVDEAVGVLQNIAAIECYGGVQRTTDAPVLTKNSAGVSFSRV